MNNEVKIYTKTNTIMSDEEVRKIMDKMNKNGVKLTIKQDVIVEGITISKGALFNSIEFEVRNCSNVEFEIIKP